jgi:putative FmdB family regulatory protein
MPTYEYVCEACEYAFEKFHSMKDDPIRKCPECGKLKVKRLIGSGGAILFKGGGFYQTDYRSQGYKESVKKETASPAPAPAAAPAAGCGSGACGSDKIKAS